MKKLLEKLWYGNICPDSECRCEAKETKELIGYITNHHDSLMATLTDKQKKLLEKLDDCNAELAEINEREIFVYAFRLGARIVAKILGSDTEA